MAGVAALGEDVMLGSVCESGHESGTEPSQIH